MTPTFLARPHADTPPETAVPALWGPGALALRWGQAGLAAPFDAARSHYAGAVAAGLVPRSLLASARLERALDAAEKLCLGALARRR